MQAAERLWADLFSEKNFYAFEFTRDILVENIPFNFYCNEVKFAVLIEDKPTREEIIERNSFIKELENGGYEVVLLSANEVIDQYTETVNLLDKKFTSITRFQCG